MKTTAKTWSSTKYQGLYRHASGTYYARLSVGGKKTWRSLKTDLLSIARTEHDKLRQENEAVAKLSKEIKIVERMTFGEALAAKLEQVEADPGIKSATKVYWSDTAKAILKSWAGLADLEIRRMTQEDCQNWAGRYAKNYSAGRFNSSLDFFKLVIGLAIKKGARSTNPAADLKRMKLPQKDLSCILPNRAKFTEWVRAMRKRGTQYSKRCADFVEFLAYTGMRKMEAGWVEWRHCDFIKGEILVKGDPVEGTKNSEFRRVPMIPVARELLLRMQNEPPEKNPTDKVLKVRVAQRAMDRAGKLVGMERVTNHDLRHLFATVCIESGVDIPTVSKWMGHKDGGALAMKVYGHLRNEHSQAAAAKVSFDG